MRTSYSQRLNMLGQCDIVEWFYFISVSFLENIFLERRGYCRTSRNMFDHMIFGAVLASILVVILALLKLAIEYPGCFSWCMRSVHKRTEKHSGGENDDSDHEDSPDPEHPHLSRRGSKVVTHCRSQATMSRTATDPELVKRRWDIGNVYVWLLKYILS